MGPVSSKERKTARAQTTDVAKYETRAILAATKAGLKARAALLRAYKSGKRKGLANSAIKEIKKAKPELVDAMVVSHLLGIKRVHAMASLSFSASSGAIALLGKQTKLHPEETMRLQRRYSAVAEKALSDACDLAEKRIKATLAIIIKDNLHVKDAVAQLQETFDNLGMVPDNSFMLESIFRTQMSLSYNGAKWETAQDPVIDEILWGYKYVTVGDDRVREEHAELDGTTLPKDDPFWDDAFPPNGWACRCAVIEIFEERDEVAAPEDYKIDEGFAFNPGKLMEESE
jgi:SPP1 gp7 family putative phage head morphogenesis protein